MVLTNSLSLNPGLDRCAHHPPEHIPILNLDWCEVVCVLSANKGIHLPFFLTVWSQSVGLCQLLLRNQLLVTLEQWFLLCLLSRIQSLEVVRSCPRRLRSPLSRRHVMACRARRMEEVVSAWLADASGARTDECLTASLQPAHQSSAVRSQRNQRSAEVAELTGEEAEAGSCSSRRPVGVGETCVFPPATGGGRSRASQVSPPSAAYAFFVRYSSHPTANAGRSTAGHVSWDAATSVSSGGAQLRPSPAPTPPQAPEERQATTFLEAFPVQTLLMQTQALSRLLARGG